MDKRPYGRLSIDYQVSLNDKTVKHDGRLGCDSTQIP